LRSRRLRREVNERIVELTKEFALDPATDAPMRLLCECGRDGCMRHLEMRLSEYEAARRAVPEGTKPRWRWTGSTRSSKRSALGCADCSARTG
jgi:hypothetical protein